LIFHTQPIRIIRSEASTSEAQQAQESVAAEVSRSRQDLATAQAEAAEDLGRREREVHALREKQRSLGETFFFLGGGVTGFFVLRWIWNEFLIYLEVFIIVIL
jgi:hypothetical protein